MSQTTETAYPEYQNNHTPQNYYNYRGHIDKLALQQYRHLCQEIAELEAEKEALAAGRLASSWQAGPRVSGGQLGDATAAAAQQLWHLSCLLAQCLNRLIALREAIEQAISTLTPEERRLLRLFYLQNLSAEECAERLRYSQRHFWRRHQRALQKLSELQGTGAQPQPWFAPTPQPAV